MEIRETCVTEDGDDTYVNIPRGGPIYVPNMIGPLTRVSDFESLVFNELEDLKKEICWDSVEVCDEDISVDDLKVFTEEELVDKAFEVVFKDEKVMEDSSQLIEKNPEEGNENDRESSERGLEVVPSNDSSNGSLQISDEHRDSRKNVSKQRKRKRRTYFQNYALEGSYMEKVEELVRIKQKQDEDKAAARLHSFNGNCRNNERASSSSDKTERIVSLKSTSSAIKTWSSSAREHVSMVYPETILCIEVYHPRRTWIKTQEFLVLGRQFLTEVRDKIYCLMDHIKKKAEQDDPSGYFLIEDVFCNDLREPSAIDYSKPILDWLRDSKKDALEKWEYIISGELQQKKKSVFGSEPETNLPRFKAVEMHKTRFCDLSFRLGAGYLYCHQGDCKHLIVIRDMRLVNPEDVQNRANYPLVTFQAKVRFQKCSVCKIYRAEKVTIDDKWAPQNPCYFCQVCHYMLHYNNKALLYDEFSVYDYHHE